MLCSRLTLLLALALVGCTGLDTQPTGEVPPGPVLPVPPGLQIEEIPAVGDTLGEGQVVQVTQPSPVCTSVVVRQDPAWECSAAQISEVNGTPGSYGQGPTIAPSRPAEPTGANTKAAPLQVTDCAGLAALRRPVLKQQLELQLRTARQQQLRNCLAVSKTHFFDVEGREVASCPRASSPGGGRDAGVWAASAPPLSPQNAASPTAGPGGGVGGAGAPVVRAGASEYSTTNTQVDGVDEADFVKNDEQFVYVLSARGLHVIDAWPAEVTHQVALLPLPGLPTRLFLYGTKLVVYVRVGGSGQGLPSGAQTCTYGYDCRFGAEAGQTLALIFDVGNPAAPRELVRYEMSGGYVASRRVGNIVYTVVFDRPAAAAPGLAVNLQSAGPEALEAAYLAQKQAAQDSVDQLADAYFLPWVQQQTDGSVTANISSCDRALVADAASGTSFTSLVSFDLDTLGAPQRTLIASKAGFVYASASALYMATEGSNGADGVAYSPYQGASERSLIHKFALEQLETRYLGSALIRGHVLNQFSMDEQADVLRVATSSGQVPAPDVSSNVTTLAMSQGTLSVLGELTGLAPQEDIRSVRFDGDRGFMVTFKKTDPLFVIDLAQPARPRVLGELKIPGFSTYMHPLDTDHLLAIGLDADDKGSFAYFNGIQLQIFDIAELSAPKLLHKTVIGTRGSASDALTNHLAFNYFAPKSLLALPLTVCDGGGNGSFGDKLSFSGLMLFDVSLERGIVERGRMPFVGPEESARVPSCSSWWTSSSSGVKRSIIMDDYAIGISDTFYKVASIATLDRTLASLALGGP